MTGPPRPQPGRLKDGRTPIRRASAPAASAASRAVWSVLEKGEAYTTSCSGPKPAARSCAASSLLHGWVLHGWGLHGGLHGWGLHGGCCLSARSTCSGRMQAPCSCMRASAPEALTRRRAPAAAPLQPTRAPPSHHSPAVVHTGVVQVVLALDQTPLA